MIRNEMRDKGRNSKYFQNAEHILQSAIKQFKEYGYAASSINDICERAGISRSTFYNIFSQKKDILVYMYDRLNHEKNFRDFDPEVQSNALEILWNRYKRYLILAEILGPKLLGELMQIEVRDSIGMRDAVQSQYDSWTNLVKECREQGIMEFWGTPEELVLQQRNLFHTVRGTALSGNGMRRESRIPEKYWRIGNRKYEPNLQAPSCRFFLSVIRKQRSQLRCLLFSV